MKKLIISLIAVPVFANAEDIKKYWDVFYIPIKECVLQEIQSEKTKEPVIKIKTKQELINYFKADGKKGYFVAFDTSKLPTSDICFIMYMVQKTGVKAEYFQPVEILLFGSFTRIQDAVLFKENLKKQFHLEKEKKPALPIYSSSPIGKKEEYKIEVLKL